MDHFGYMPWIQVWPVLTATQSVMLAKLTFADNTLVQYVGQDMIKLLCNQKAQLLIQSPHHQNYSEFQKGQELNVFEDVEPC